MDKRGLSAIVVNLILVLLGMVAIGVVWVVVNNLLQSGTEQTTTGFEQLSLNFELQRVLVEPDGDLQVVVKRNVGAGTISGLTFVISDGTNSKLISRETNFSELESKSFTISSSEISDLGFVKEVSVSPIVGSDYNKGTVGNVADTIGLDYYNSCLTILNSGNSNGDGIYTIDPDGVGSEPLFQVYCDMTTDGGGWTLVWSNLINGTGKPVTKITWNDAINTVSKYSGTFGNDLEKFNFYLGLKYWIFIGTNNELRYIWKYNYGVPVTEEFISTFNLNSSANYNLTFSNYQQKVGSQQAGLYLNHNGKPFTTFDSDHDAYASNCATLYSNTPWWYTSCWSGSINGGGENSGSGYYNGAYWYSSDRQWGNSTGRGAGNGWIWIR